MASKDVGFDAEFFKSTDGVFKMVQLVRIIINTALQLIRPIAILFQLFTN